LVSYLMRETAGRSGRSPDTFHDRVVALATMALGGQMRLISDLVPSSACCRCLAAS
jgi:hypothetical protein